MAAGAARLRTGQIADVLADEYRGMGMQGGDQHTAKALNVHHHRVRLTDLDDQAAFAHVKDPGSWAHSTPIMPTSAIK